jgi:hypothetical protein
MPHLIDDLAISRNRVRKVDFDDGRGRRHTVYCT